MTIERRIDRGSPALEERIDARTGALTVRYAPTWVGVREYQREDGSISRELHRPEQVCSAGFCAQLARLPIPIGHPEDEHGPVWLHVDPRAPGPAGYSVREPRDFAVGWTGERVEMRPCAEWPQIEIPTVSATYVDQRGIALLRAGVLESSLGYDVFVDRTPGVWVAPDGQAHEYDAEHVLDPADPRLAALPPAERALLGPNHLACLPYGRGGAQAAVRWDAAPRPRVGNASDVPSPQRPGKPRKIADVTTTRLPLPAEIRAICRDGMASLELPDDPAIVGQWEAALATISGMLADYKSKLAGAEGAAAAAAEKIGALEAEVEDLRPLADRGRKLDADLSAGQVKALGLEPQGKTGPEIREAAVGALSPEALSRYAPGTPQRAIAVDAAFAVLASAPAKSAPKAGERPLSVADQAPAPKSTTVTAARGRFSEEA